MKFRFKIQQYQSDAVESVVRVFRGQHYSDGISYVRDLGEKKPVLPTVMDQISMFPDPQMSFDEIIDDTGYKNEAVRLTDAELLANIHALQTDNNIHLSDGLVKGMGCCSLDVEMETGTGKTYVYIKTMFELNKRYGWSKFIVVVPSIAIREGVKKSFEITTDHFMEHYGKKARFFIYNSANLNQLDSFSADSGINVMIINTQAFAASLKEDGKSKEARIIYSKRDEFASRRPIDVIAANRPIIIMDEPQKMGGDVTQKALKAFNPLFCLNYSATHAKQHNLVYVLDALDAYNKRLVKRIEVKGFEVKNFRGTDQYLYMETIILSPKKPPQVRLELEIAYNKSINREFRILGKGDNLYYISNEMEQYRGFTIADIDPIAGTVTFTNGDVIRKGDVVGDVSEKDMRRVQIRETIISHFEKEEQNFNMGIKTLSLFFIDEVAKYRQYDEDGNEVLGEYGRIFEEEYYAVLAEYRKFLNPAYLAYLDGISAESTHKGYFSIDKKTGRAVDSALKRGSEFSDDISAYDLILKNKERLLSFEEPTRFIFSHSALREGWDNPNVFQICTLKHGGDSSTQKRQEVGRGLRLCVNQQGERMDADSCGDNVQVINTLTVIASEGYSTFVRDLQDQTRSVLYDRPTKATVEYFTGKTIMVSGQPIKIDQLQAKQIYKYLLKNDYISDDDSITQEYRTALAGNTLEPLPEALQPYAPEVHKLIQAIYDDSILKDMFKDGNQTKPPENPLNERFYKDAFQALWRAINHRYAYTVDFDSDELIRNSWHEFIKAIMNAGYLSGDLILSRNAIFYSYALYLIAKHRFKASYNENMHLTSLWFFYASLVSLYTGSFESTVENHLNTIKTFATLDEYKEFIISRVNERLTNDYFDITLVGSEGLAVSGRGNNAWNAYVAALNIMDAKILFSKSNLLMSKLFDPGTDGNRKSLEKHHLFPKAYLKSQGYTDAKINQMANYAFIDWKDNMDILDESPSAYYPIICAGMSNGQIRIMEEENALPHGWEKMTYEEFLEERRKLMAAKIKAAFELLRNAAFC